MRTPVWPVEGSLFRELTTGLDSPEGVVWDPERRVLYAGGRHGQLYRAALDGNSEQIAHLGEGSFVLGLAVDGQGRIYACDRGNGRLLRVNPTSPTIETYSEGTQERPMVTPNFPAFADNGDLYVSDSGTWGQRDGVVFRIPAGGPTEVWTDALPDFTNGLALAPAGDALYVAESGQSSIWRVAILEDGTAGTPEKVWSVPNVFTDGLAFDSAGGLYASLYRPDAIYRVDPASHTAELFVHDWTAQFLQAPTNVAFAGDDLSLLVTANLAGEHLSIYTGALPAPGNPLARPFVP